MTKLAAIAGLISSLWLLLAGGVLFYIVPHDGSATMSDGLFMAFCLTMAGMVGTIGCLTIRDN
jgi:hypothetical protein